MTDKNSVKKLTSAGSALILAVVLTSLLAIVGVMFVMVARIDRISTSAISENRELDSAVEAVVAKISQELVLDIPRPGTGGPEYYDYPGEKDKWLASLEPHKDGGYKWRQISDVTGYIEKAIPGVKGSWDTQDIEITNNAIIEDHKEIELDNNGDLQDQLADADGDGVADSKWVELDGINSNKGRPIYAAIRVIDNGGMLNVNTAYKFDRSIPGTDGEYVDGSDQMQINLFALSKRGKSNTIVQLDDARLGTGSPDNYIRDVVWRYHPPAKGTKYTPFDISDELELRNRYTLNREDIDSRIEEVWDGAFQSGPWGSPYLSVPVSPSGSPLNSWEDEVYYDYDVNDPNIEDDYSYRHIGTIYNMDRIIKPDGRKMLNINDPCVSVVSVYETIKTALRNTVRDVNDIAAQVAVNLRDFRDGDENVTTIDVNNTTYYGFERPCVYISELTHKFVLEPGGISPEPPTIHRSYAIELYKPYLQDNDPYEWRLRVDGDVVEDPIDWSKGSKQFHVILFEDPNMPLGKSLGKEVKFKDSNNDPNYDGEPYEAEHLHFAGGDVIELQRKVAGGYLTVDYIKLQEPPPGGGDWMKEDGKSHSIQRDITRHKCIRRLWSNPGIKSFPSLGHKDNQDYENGDSIYIQAHPENKHFTNVGEIGMLFREDVYSRTWSDEDTDDEVRLDLADPNYHGLFKYLTVFDPSVDKINNDGDYKNGLENTDEIALNETPELKIPGRININTAPWYVIAQLPWMEPGIARAIVAYRDKTFIADQNSINYANRKTATGLDGLREEAGFASIAELATVINESGEDDYSMHYYILGAESDDLDNYPDLSYSDGAPDDFEERDVIFSRISNLVTVRSDVFTAYILVRIGTDGPQKRVIAILDRSNVYPPNGGRVMLVALHPVPDPR